MKGIHTDGDEDEDVGEVVEDISVEGVVQAAGRVSLRRGGTDGMGTHSPGK